MRLLSALAALLFLVAPSTADDSKPPVIYDFDGTFEEATFAVESAIVNQGLVIDYVSHVGEMLNRTAKDVGSEKSIFDAADIFIFCSAVHSRNAMEQDPMLITHCPYGIFVADRSGKVIVGFRDLPDGPLQPVEDLLHTIVKEATAN